MKHKSYEDFDEEVQELWVDGVGYPEGIESADHNESPHEVLAAVDKQLKKHGLEIVGYNTGGDFYAWKIEPL